MLKAILANLKKTWPVLAVLVLVLGAGSWYLKQQPHVQSPILPTALTKMEPHIELAFQDVTMQGREKGTVRWRIAAKQVKASQNQQYIYFEQHPRGSFYNVKDWSQKEGEPPKNQTVDWTADKAEYDSLMDEMTMTGSASFVTENQDRLNTDHVRYRAKLHQVLMEKPVELRTHDQLVMRSHEATADTQMENVQLFGNVELISPLKGEENPL
ncbi:MAG TPA: LPS export ABC transporter periplasmic protein LptC [Pantanalinema sp.]